MGHEDKRHAIMYAAEKLFTNRRFHEVTLDGVAAEAKVGKGTIYRFFDDKEDLFFQTATSGFDELCELIRARVPEGAGFRARLLGACRQIEAYFERRRQLTRMMQVEEDRLMSETGALRKRWKAKREKLVGAVADIIRQGAAEGALRSDVGPEILANYLLGMLRTRACELCAHRETAHSLNFLLDVFYHGVSSPPVTSVSSQGEAHAS